MYSFYSCWFFILFLFLFLFVFYSFQIFFFKFYAIFDGYNTFSEQVRVIIIILLFIYLSMLFFKDSLKY